LENRSLADPLLVHILAVLVLALKLQEDDLRVLRQVCDILADLFEAVSCFQDSFGENVNDTSGLKICLGGKERSDSGKWKMPATQHGKSQGNERSCYERTTRSCGSYSWVSYRLSFDGRV
jgi:hypothetical protein